MTMPTKLVVSCATGQTEEIELTPEEIAQAEADAAAAAAAEAERVAAEEAAALAEAEKEANIAKVPTLEAAVDELIVAVLAP
jgi:hypothetical protein